MALAVAALVGGTLVAQADSKPVPPAKQASNMGRGQPKPAKAPSVNKGGGRADFDAVARRVQEYLTSIPGYQPGDLIARREATAILDCAAELGWIPPQRAAILEQVLDDHSLLVRKLRSRSGRTLMRQCARRSLPFDVLDRLANLPEGERILQSLIDGPDGYKLVEYIAQTPGGRALGRQLQAVPRGQNFNQPTGRIYTAEQLLARLKQLCAPENRDAPPTRS
jgi:hypothetical protein